MLAPTYLNVFIQPAYTYLLPTYLLIKNNNTKNVVNLNMNST
jgi:hypothetical protein